MADKSKLDELVSKTHKDQGVWLLNSYWEEFGEREAENVWKFVHKAQELDEAKRAEGCDLDEFQAHRFLEHFKETLTVQAMRERLRSSGAIVGNPKRVPLTHILTIKYDVDWHKLVNAPQGSKEEIDKAKKVLDEVQNAFEQAAARDAEAQAALEESTRREADAKAKEAEAKQREAAAREAEAQAKQREADAKAAAEQARQAAEQAKADEAEAKAREDELRAAKAELEAALAEVKAQEDTFNARTAELTRLSEEGSVVAKNRAKNELAQHLSSDPLPLRRAKITAEAAVKKADRAALAAKAATDKASQARAAAEQARTAADDAASQASQARAAAEAATQQASQARAAAEEAAQQATAARGHSEAAKAAAEAAVEEARRQLAAAEAYLEEAKQRLPKGATWWLERELEEKRRYLPTSKGGGMRRAGGGQA